MFYSRSARLKDIQAIPYRLEVEPTGRDHLRFSRAEHDGPKSLMKDQCKFVTYYPAKHALFLASFPWTDVLL